MAKVIATGAAPEGSLGSIGVRFLIGGEESGDGFSLVEHSMPPSALAAPLHRHSREDEYSFVLEGRVGALLGGEVVFGEPGDLIFKPRDQWHTFWNAGSEPAHILEIISPAGFEHCFAKVAKMMESADPPGPEEMASAAALYGVEIDFGSIPHLLQTYGLTFGPSSVPA